MNRLSKQLHQLTEEALASAPSGFGLTAGDDSVSASVSTLAAMADPAGLVWSQHQAPAATASTAPAPAAPTARFGASPAQPPQGRRLFNNGDTPNPSFGAFSISAPALPPGASHEVHLQLQATTTPSTTTRVDQLPAQVSDERAQASDEYAGA